MKYTLIALLLFFLCPCLRAGTNAPENPPVVFTLNADLLQKNRSRVMAKDPALMPAYQKLLRDADKALREGPFTVVSKKQVPPSGDKHDFMSLAPYFWPDPSKPGGLPYMRKDGQTNPEVADYTDKEYLPKLIKLVNSLSEAYYFSGDPKYAQHAANLLRVWFLNPDTKMNPNMNFAQAIKGQNTGRGAGLIDARHFIRLIDDIGMLHESKAWTEADQKGMQQWFAAFVHWMQTSENGLDEIDAPNNHGTWYDVLRLSATLFTDSTAAAKKIVENVKGRLDKQMDAAGSFPKEMERTIALHYSLFNLEAFFLAASMAEKVNMDFWHFSTPSGASLKKGFDFLKPFITKEKNWTGQQIKPFPVEEGYPVLLMAAAKYNCTSCRDTVKKLAGEEGEKLEAWLLY